MERKDEGKLKKFIEYVFIGVAIVEVGVPLCKKIIEKIRRGWENLPIVPTYDNYLPPSYQKNLSSTSSPLTSPSFQLPTSPNLVLVKENKLNIKNLKLWEYVKVPSIVAICGWRGEGKSALGWKILEIFHSFNYPCYAYRIPEEKCKYLPSWVGVINNFDDLPNGSVLLMDEVHLFFHSRESSLKRFVELSNFINLSRQKRITLIFVTQQTRQIDINLISMVDTIFLKDPGELFFEREHLKGIIEKAREEFKKIPPEERKKWVYAFKTKEGIGEFFQVDLPEFWNENMSFLFDKTLDFSDKDGIVQSKILTKEERNRQIIEFKNRNPDISIRKLAQIFNVSPGTVVNALKNYPYKKNNK